MPQSPRQEAPHIQLSPDDSTSTDDSLGNSKAEVDSGSPQPVSKFTNIQKIGRVSLSILICGAAIVLGSVGFLWYLWTAGPSSGPWHAIAVRNWFPRSVALLSLATRNSLGLISAIATGMIAALALESFIVLLLNLASVSTLRNANGGPYLLFWWLCRSAWYSRRRWRTVWLQVLIALLALLSFATQFMSTVLLSDLGSRVIPGRETTSVLPTNFIYDQNGTIPTVVRSSMWLRKPPVYPVFAEYHEDSTLNDEDNIDDTGRTLRAFLPIQDQQSRSEIASWTGRATVLDSRVICVQPELSLERVHILDGSLAVTGTIRPAFEIKNAGLMLGTCNGGYLPLDKWSDRPSASFKCVTPLSRSTSTDDTHANSAEQRLRSDIDQSRLTVCQPAGHTAGFLQSAFGDRCAPSGYIGSAPSSYSYGQAYLLLDVSHGSEDDWSLAIPQVENDAYTGSPDSPGVPPLAYSTHGPHEEWFDLIYSSTGNLNLSVTLCYATIDTADLNVTVSSHTNRTEPVAVYDSSSERYSFHRIRAQLGQTSNGTVNYNDTDARGVLQLQARNWTARESNGDYYAPNETETNINWMNDFINMAGPIEFNSWSFEAGMDYSAFLWDDYLEYNLWNKVSHLSVDPSLVSLTQEILRQGGSAAFAVQSLLTVLASNIYYDQMEQFNDRQNVTQTAYITVQAPVRHRGLIGTTVVLGSFLVLVLVIIVPLFLVRTDISTLGNAWQVVAQVGDSDMTKSILAAAPLAKDSRAEHTVKTKEPIKTRRRWIWFGKEREPTEKWSNHEIIGIRRKHTVNGDKTEIVPLEERMRIHHDDEEIQQQRQPPAELTGEEIRAGLEAEGHPLLDATNIDTSHRGADVNFDGQPETRVARVPQADMQTRRLSSPRSSVPAPRNGER